MESRAELSSLRRSESESASQSVDHHGLTSSARPSNGLNMVANALAPTQTQVRTGQRRNFSTWLDINHFLRNGASKTRRRSAASASLVVRPQLKVHRTQTLTRSLTSRRTSLSAALALANSRTAREQDELERTTAEYELMMQHFQLRKVDGSPMTIADAKKKDLWTDLNPSTASDSSNSPTVLQRKTATDFSSKALATHFNTLTSDSDTGAGRNGEFAGDDDDDNGQGLRKNYHAMTRQVALNNDSQPLQQQQPRRFSFKTRSNQLGQVVDITSNGSDQKNDEAASRISASGGGPSSPHGLSVEHTHQSHGFVASKPPSAKIDANRFSWRRFIRKHKRRLRSFVRRALTPFSPVGTMGKLRALVMGVVFALQVVYLPSVPVYLPQGSDSVTAVNISFEIAFLVDFLLHFNMAYYEPKSLALVKSRRKIAWQYFKGWFVVDLLSSVPVDTIVWFGISAEDNSAQKEVDAAHVLFHTLLRVPRLYHVLSLLNEFLLLSRKLSAGRDFIARLFYSRYSHLMRILRLILLVVLTAHYMACGWQLVTKNDPDAPNAVQPDATVFERYVADVYYSLLLIQGQGDVRGTSVQQNIFSIVAVLLGSVVLAIVFGNVAMLVANFHANATNYQRKMEVVFATMNKMKLPLELRQRIHQYYDHLWQEYESLDGDIVKFSKELSHTLALEVGLYKYMNLIMRVPIWRACSPDFVTQVVLNLVIRVYLPDDYIIRQGETDAEMYMVNRGVCELTDANEVFDRPISSSHSRMDRAPRSKRGSGSRTSSWRTSGSATSGSGSDFGDLTGMQYRVSPLSRRSSQQRIIKEAQHQSLLQASAAPMTTSSGDRDWGSNNSSDDDNSDGARPANLQHFKTLEVQQKRLRRINPGQSFGEMALLMNYKRTVNVRAMTYVEMCILERDKFQQILSRYPEDRLKVLTSMLTSCVDKREIPFSWEEICNLVATKRYMAPSAVIEHGDNLTTEDIVEVLLDTINHNVVDESIIFGFQDRTTAGVAGCVDNGSMRQNLFRRKRSSRTGLLSSSPSVSSLDQALMATITTPGTAPVAASEALPVASELVPQQSTTTTTPTGTPERRTSQSHIPLLTPPVASQVPDQLEALTARIHAMEQGQDDLFALMHKLLRSFARLEGESVEPKVRKARNASLSVTHHPQPLDCSWPGLENSAAAAVGLMALSERTPELWPRHSLFDPEDTQSTAISEPTPMTASPFGEVVGGQSNAKVVPMGTSSLRHLSIPALLHRASKPRGEASSDRANDESDGASSSAACADSSVPRHHGSHSRRSKHNLNHYRLPSSQLRPDLFRRSSLNLLRGAPSPRATSFADQLYATATSAAHERRSPVIKRETRSGEDISSIRE